MSYRFYPMSKMDHKALCKRVTHSFLEGDEEEVIYNEIESGALVPSEFFRKSTFTANSEVVEDEGFSPSEFHEVMHGPRFQLLPEPAIGLFDKLHPLQLRTRPNISQYGLDQHFIPTPGDLKRIDAKFWGHIPRILNPLYIPKYVIVGLQLIVKRYRFPFWMKSMAEKSSNTFKLVSRALRLLFAANEHAVEAEILNELACIINVRYVTEAILPALDNLLKLKKEIK